METQHYPNQKLSNSGLLGKEHGLSVDDKSLHPLGNSTTTDYAPLAGIPIATSPLAQSFIENQNSSNLGHQNDLEENLGMSSHRIDENGLRRSGSSASMSQLSGSLSRGNTLKKQKSLSRRSSLKRSGSRRSLRPGSIGGIGDDYGSKVDRNSVFYSPVPTSGSPTDILANRFQAWRKFLKDLISHFRDLQSSYDSRSKALLKVSNSINNFNLPPIFMETGGLNDATQILRDYHKQALAENSKAREVQNDVIAQLNGLRADLGQKIKEIKSLSGDFKSSVEKEREATRKAVNNLQEVIAAVDENPQATIGKSDPYVVRLAVDRQVDRQIDEENYLHRAYLNLESSGRELESIVVGEVQKAYNAFAGILKREADMTYGSIDELRSGPITMAKDHEWSVFVEQDEHFVSPNVPLRRVEDIEYPGKTHPSAAEVRAGMLERKSKYLKSYTPGWYVLSPTHLHEFKSADRLYTQPPVMSLYLADQKLGAHSQPGSSSHKFMIKGRQTGPMHRGHSWVFRAESYDTMLAWYDDIKSLTEKRGEDRINFVRKHARSFSANSAGSASSMEDDEADRIPYSGQSSVSNNITAKEEISSQRPQPGGRFPSDVQTEARSQAPEFSSSSDGEQETIMDTQKGLQIQRLESNLESKIEQDLIDKATVQSQTSQRGKQPQTAALEQTRGEFESTQTDGLGIGATLGDISNRPPEPIVIWSQDHPVVVQRSRFREEFHHDSSNDMLERSQPFDRLERLPPQEPKPLSKKSDQTIADPGPGPGGLNVIIPQSELVITLGPAETGKKTELPKEATSTTATATATTAYSNSGLSEMANATNKKTNESINPVGRRDIDVGLKHFHVPGEFPEQAVH